MSLFIFLIHTLSHFPKTGTVKQIIVGSFVHMHTNMHKHILYTHGLRHTPTTPPHPFPLPHTPDTHVVVCVKERSSLFCARKLLRPSAVVLCVCVASSACMQPRGLASDLIRMCVLSVATCGRHHVLAWCLISCTQQLRVLVVCVHLLVLGLMLFALAYLLACSQPLVCDRTPLQLLVNWRVCLTSREFVFVFKCFIRDVGVRLRNGLCLFNCLLVASSAWSWFTYSVYYLLACRALLLSLSLEWYVWQSHVLFIR